MAEDLRTPRGTLTMRASARNIVEQPVCVERVWISTPAQRDGNESYEMQLHTYMYMYKVCSM